MHGYITSQHTFPVFYIQKSFFKAYYIYELRVLIDVQHTPVTVTIVMLYRAEPCSNTSLTSNETLTEVSANVIYILTLFILTVKPRKKLTHSNAVAFVTRHLI